MFYCKNVILSSPHRQSVLRINDVSSIDSISLANSYLTMTLLFLIFQIYLIYRFHALQRPGQGRKLISDKWQIFIFSPFFKVCRQCFWVNVKFPCHMLFIASLVKCQFLLIFCVAVFFADLKKNMLTFDLFKLPVFTNEETRK